MAKKLNIFLSSRSVDEAIRELRAYEQSLTDKQNLLVERVGRRLEEYARMGFSAAVVDDIVNAGPRPANVTITTDPSSDGTCVVIASGKDAVWVEFGAGVYHNGSVGSSPHPNGGQLGMTIGSYGRGRGKGNVWGYYSPEDGGLVLTHGTPAQMPLYNAAIAVAKDIGQIAREVFEN